MRKPDPSDERAIREIMLARSAPIGAPKPDVLIEPKSAKPILSETEGK